MGKIIVKYDYASKSFFGRWWGLILFPLLLIWLIFRDNGFCGYLEIDGKTTRLRYNKKNHPQVIEVAPGVHDIVYRKKSKLAIAVNNWARSDGGTLERVLDRAGAFSDYELDGVSLEFGTATVLELFAEGGIARQCRVVSLEGLPEDDDEEEDKEEQGEAAAAKPAPAKKGHGALIAVVAVLGFFLIVGIVASVYNLGIGRAVSGEKAVTASAAPSTAAVAAVTTAAVTEASVPETSASDIYGVLDVYPTQVDGGQNMTVDADGGLFLRRGSGTQYESILLMDDNAAITVYCTENGWCFVSYSGTYGWCSAEFVVPEGTGAQTDPAGSGGYTDAQIEAAINSANAVIDSYRGKVTAGGVKTLTADEVIPFFEKAEDFYVTSENYFCGIFDNIGDYISPANESSGYYFMYQSVSDPEITSLEALCDITFSMFSDSVAANMLYGKVFAIGSQLYAMGGGKGFEGRYISHTYNVAPRGDGYTLTVTVREYGEMGNESSVVSHDAVMNIIREDGALVFESISIIYS